MQKFSKDEIVFRTCQIIVKHIRNHVEEGRDGIHSRIFSHFLHPEIEFVYLGKSPETTSTTDHHPEHVVPCTTLIIETRKLISEGRLNDDEIAKLLQKHWKIATITKIQARKLDVELGYKWNMPEGWNFETGETLARLKEAKITLA